MDNVTSGELSFAAEDLVTVDSDACTIILLYLLGNGSPIVREGALLGLDTDYRLSDKRVREAIIFAKEHDASVGVRAAASDILESYDD